MNSVIENKQIENSSTFWHSKLGHAPMSIIKLIQVLNKLHVDSVSPCVVCRLAKQQRLRFTPSISSSS
ncbi:hypothetical protein LIER_15138 [Lithospermum erythrorhizon]|uniref:GAG-pre-integrase domain-containing protein n=1 Tax=Lithospermum erythrorhizon TaxID=34254 RepID=A0AAV3Q378_LITER